MPLLDTPERDLEPEVRPRAQRVPEPCPAGSPRRAWRALRVLPSPGTAAARPVWVRQPAQLRGLGKGSALGVGPLPQPHRRRSSRRAPAKARSFRAIAALRAGDPSATFDRRERLTHSSTESKIHRSTEATRGRLGPGSGLRCSGLGPREGQKLSFSAGRAGEPPVGLGPSAAVPRAPNVGLESFRTRGRGKLECGRVSR